MISNYQEKLQDFYKMRDTLISEGFNYSTDFETYSKVEMREIAFELIKEKKVNVSLLLHTKDYFDYNDHVCRAQIYLQSNAECLTQEEWSFLKRVLS